VKNFLFLLMFAVMAFNCFAQGLIINEVSNGVDSTKEYFELVVIGSQTDPTGFVDLGGWIIDDNNGDFKLSGAGVGIALGHIRIRPGFLSNVKPGSIILIYNSVERSFPNDPLDSNGDCVYIIPINDVSLDNTATLPTTSNTNYFPVTYLAIKIWDRIGLRNGGDVAQTRRPDGVFFHGFSYGDVTGLFPIFPSSGTNSFNVSTLTGTGKNYIFNCGNFTSASNFTSAAASTNETPGAPNNNQNRYFINSIRNGTYDYSNLSNATNCGSSTTLASCEEILPIELIFFNGINTDFKRILQWQTSSESGLSYFEISKSSNGINWTPLGMMEADNSNNWSSYELYDLNLEDCYYQLSVIDVFGSTNILKTIFISGKESEMIFQRDGEFLLTTAVSFEIFDFSGKQLKNGSVDNNIISIDWLSSGSYIIALKDIGGTTRYKIFTK